MSNKTKKALQFIGFFGFTLAAFVCYANYKKNPADIPGCDELVDIAKDTICERLPASAKRKEIVAC